MSTDCRGGGVGEGGEGRMLSEAASCTQGNRERERERTWDKKKDSEQLRNRDVRERGRQRET